MMKAPRGFSLLEMAVVLMVVTLLLGGMLIPLATQVEQKRIAETQKTLADAQEALIGFAIANGRLPCPDLPIGGTPNDGKEDWLTSTSQCVAQEGELPWATLGVGSIDAWGNRLRYSAGTQFTNPAQFTLTATGQLNVCEDTGCASQLASNVPAIVLSHGKNGYGAVNANTTAGAAATMNPSPPGSNQDETTNATTNTTTYISRTRTQASTPCSDTAAGSTKCEFDDIVVWLSSNVLFNRMVAAGKLP